jgi:ferredoxin--NADP+ reductase
MLSTLEPGDEILDITGPLGKPTEMHDGSWCVIGGGVGLAIAYPVARMLVESGHEVHAIMGARTKDLLLDGPAVRGAPRLPTTCTSAPTTAPTGEKGVVTVHRSSACCQAHGQIDQTFVRGPRAGDEVLGASPARSTACPSSPP